MDGQGTAESLVEQLVHNLTSRIEGELREVSDGLMIDFVCWRIVLLGIEYPTLVGVGGFVSWHLHCSAMVKELISVDPHHIRWVDGVTVTGNREFVASNTAPFAGLLSLRLAWTYCSALEESNEGIRVHVSSLCDEGWGTWRGISGGSTGACSPAVLFAEQNSQTVAGVDVILWVLIDSLVTWSWLLDAVSILVTLLIYLYLDQWW